MLNRFIRHLKEGIKAVGRNSAMSISSISAVNITLLIISVFLVISFNLDSIAVGVEDEIMLSALVDSNYETDEQITIIKEELTKISGIVSIEFSHKDAELEYFLSSYSEQEKALYMPDGADNPLPHTFYITIEEDLEIDGVAQIVSAVEGIKEVNYGGELTIDLIELINLVRYSGVIVVFALTALAIYLMSNTIKLTILARQREIAIMRNVGATNGFIRAPFIVEGIVIGILGSVIPCAVTVFGYYFLFENVNGIIITEVFTLLDPRPFVFYVSLILIAVGVGVGIIGSFLSVTKYLRYKR